MGILDRAKKITDKVKGGSFKLISDELLADIVMMSAAKQETVNEVLKTRGSDYRVGKVEIEMGIPPSIIFGISRCPEPKPESPTPAIGIGSEE